MNQENKISVVINTYNAERDLEQVLEAVKDFDEVLICDMESTDATLDIARKYGCRIVTFPKANHKSAEPARTFAIQQASSKWVLVVDADEIVTPQLREELYRRIASDGCPAGLYIPRLNQFMGKTLTCAYPDYQLRFFIREGTEWPPYVHTFPKVQGPSTICQSLGENWLSCIWQTTVCTPSWRKTIVIAIMMWRRKLTNDGEQEHCSGDLSGASSSAM